MKPPVVCRVQRRAEHPTVAGVGERMPETAGCESTLGPYGPPGAARVRNVTPPSVVRWMLEQYLMPHDTLPSTHQSAALAAVNARGTKPDGPVEGEWITAADGDDERPDASVDVPGPPDRFAAEAPHPANANTRAPARTELHNPPRPTR